MKNHPHDQTGRVLYLGRDTGITDQLDSIDSLEWEQITSLDAPGNSKTNIDLILFDLSPDGPFNFEQFERVRESYPAAPVIILDTEERDHAGDGTTVEGVQDYLIKPELNRDLLDRSIRYAMDRSELVETLQDQRQRLKQSNDELQNFAYVISHDLQEPLRMITGYLELLDDRYGGEIDEKADKYINEAVDGAERMKTMISDLLTYSRVNTEGDELKPVDANEILDNLISDFQRVIDENNATIDVEPLPDVMADRGQLRHLFQNLLENALKFSGEEDPVVEVSADRDGDMVEFLVSDNGIGIAPENQEDVFMIFRRVHKEEYDGTGLGLALCKRIVNRHGGRIHVESDGENGTTFHFILKEAPSDGR